MAAFNGTMAPMSYESVMASAQEGGWSNPGFDWGATVKFLVWPSCRSTSSRLGARRCGG